MGHAALAASGQLRQSHRVRPEPGRHKERFPFRACWLQDIAIRPSPRWRSATSIRTRETRGDRRSDDADDQERNQRGSIRVVVMHGDHPLAWAGRPAWVSKSKIDAKKRDPGAMGWACNQCTHHL